MLATQPAPDKVRRLSQAAPGGHQARDETAHSSAATMSPDDIRQRLHGLRVFIVEDDAMISMMLATMLANFGCVVVGAAATVESALLMASTTNDIDVAILDVNIDGEVIFPVADLLLARDVPCVFSTGYATTFMAERYPLCRLLHKPYASGGLAKILLALQVGA